MNHGCQMSGKTSVGIHCPQKHISLRKFRRPLFLALGFNGSLGDLACLLNLGDTLNHTDSNGLGASQ